MFPNNVKLFEDKEKLQSINLNFWKKVFVEYILKTQCSAIQKNKKKCCNPSIYENLCRKHLNPSQKLNLKIIESQEKLIYF